MVGKQGEFLDEYTLADKAEPFGLAIEHDLAGGSKWLGQGRGRADLSRRPADRHDDSSRKSGDVSGDDSRRHRSESFCEVFRRPE